MRERLALALIKSLHFVATRGPVAWAANWNARANEGFLNELFGERPMHLSDVLPWDARPARPIFTCGDFPVAGDEHSTTPSPESSYCSPTDRAPFLAQAPLEVSLSARGSDCRGERTRESREPKGSSS